MPGFALTYSCTVNDAILPDDPRFWVAMAPGGKKPYCPAESLSEGCTDPKTLFVSHSGGAMNRGQMLNLVKKLAFEHTGTPTTPHLYRDIVAYAWLRAHPEEYLTVSKLLWHKNINTTIRIYGHRFDESTGAARMDDWRARRKMGI